MMLGLNETVMLYEGKGCPRCNFTGYLGRKAIHEILLVDEGMQELISARETSHRISAYAQEHGMVTLKQDMLRNVLAGESTVQEYVKAVYTI